MKNLFLFLMLSLSIFPQGSLRAQDEPEEVKDRGRASSTVSEEDQETHGSAELEMVTQRMKELTGSLQQMPEIPRLNQTLMIPAVDPKMLSHKKTPETQDQKSETKQKEKTP